MDDSMATMVPMPSNALHEMLQRMREGAAATNERRKGYNACETKHRTKYLKAYPIANGQDGLYGCALNVAPLENPRSTIARTEENPQMIAALATADTMARRRT